LIALTEIERARQRIAGVVRPSPLVQLGGEASAEIWLKLEALQPVGSFKLRGAANAILSAPDEAVARGVWTTSAGNMARAVAWMARELGVPALVVAPEHAPTAKLVPTERLGALVVRVPYDTWWETMESGRFDGAEGFFVHPVRDEAVMAGNGTIGLELVEQLDTFDTVLVPWGGGGLTTGIASALAQTRPDVRVLACEPETGAPVAAALAVGGEPVAVEYRPSFVDGAGAKALLADVWDHARALIGGSTVSTLDEVAAAIRTLAGKAKIVAEGAGALSVAAALSGRAGKGRIVCVVSGGNVDTAVLAEILEGRTPK
jgi:threonine dehydratase